MELIQNLVFEFLAFVKESHLTIILVALVFIVFDTIDLYCREHKSIIEHKKMLFWLFVQYLLITTVFGFILIMIAKAFNLIIA